eukprot:742723-Pelagomonas_calceolata.AAC.4
MEGPACTPPALVDAGLPAALPSCPDPSGTAAKPRDALEKRLDAALSAASMFVPPLMRACMQGKQLTPLNVGADYLSKESYCNDVFKKVQAAVKAGKQRSSQLACKLTFARATAQQLLSDHFQIFQHWIYAKYGVDKRTWPTLIITCMVQKTQGAVEQEIRLQFLVVGSHINRELLETKPVLNLL